MQISCCSKSFLFSLSKKRAEEEESLITKKLDRFETNEGKQKRNQRFLFTFIYHFYLITAKMLHTKLFDFLRPAKKDEKLKVIVSEATEKARIIERVTELKII